MKTSVWSLGLLALGLPFTACKRQGESSPPASAAPVAENAPAASAAVAAPAPTPSPAGVVAAQPAVVGKNATIDLQKVMNDCLPAKDARQRIESLRDEVKTDVEARRKRIDTLAETVGTTGKRLQNPALTRQEREKLVKDLSAKRDELKALEGEFKEFTARREKALNEKIRLELGKLLTEIRSQAETMAKAEGYVWVMDRSGVTSNQTPAVLYVKSSLPDLTAAVTQAVNAKFAK